MAEKILVVDDEPEVAEMIAELLREAGYQPEMYTDSVAAFRQLSAAAYDLVESDPGVQARAQTLREALTAWWVAHAPRLADLPARRDLNAVRAEFLDSFVAAVEPLNVLDRLKLAGVIATWWTDTLPDFKTLLENGFPGVIDGWVDAIADDDIKSFGGNRFARARKYGVSFCMVRWWVRWAQDLAPQETQHQFCLPLAAPSLREFTGPGQDRLLPGCRGLPWLRSHRRPPWLPVMVSNRCPRKRVRLMDAAAGAIHSADSNCPSCHWPPSV